MLYACHIELSSKSDRSQLCLDFKIGDSANFLYYVGYLRILASYQVKETSCVASKTSNLLDSKILCFFFFQ